MNSVFLDTPGWFAALSPKSRSRAASALSIEGWSVNVELAGFELVP